MPILNSDLVDPERGMFSVLGLVVIPVRIGGSYWWHCEDIDREGARGAIFRAYESEGLKQGAYEVAAITVVDVTDDPDEPDIETLEQSGVSALDEVLRQGITEQFLADGREMRRWMSSYLNESGRLKGLVTAYIVRDAGKERQFIALRIKVKDRKIVALGSFDLAEERVLAGPIIDAIRSIVVLP